jgi:small subunit ribosomal protein S8
MPVTDPIADMLTRIRNAQLVRHTAAEMPTSKAKVAIAEILKQEGYIEEYEIVDKKPHDLLRLRLRYVARKEPAITGLKRVSKPGLRLHVQRREIARAHGGLGISIISTSQGIMTGRQAWTKGLGGELMAYVW